MFFMKRTRPLVIAGLAALATWTVSCETDHGNQSRGKGTEIDNTNSKWQSIGNCWIYAGMAWVESLHMTATGEKLDLSETYLTYAHIKQQLLNDPTLTKVATGGFWWELKDLIILNGVMKEADFIPAEANVTKSEVQAKAVARINESLANGALKNDRSLETVITELERAFGFNSRAIEDKIIFPRELVARKNGAEEISLRSELRSWNEEPAEGDKVQLMRRVIRALNDRKPVIITWMVDFNALDGQGVFSMEKLQAAGRPGRQGMHMTVLEDYLASGVNEADPAKPAFTVGEGTVAPELQELAAKYGRIDAFVVKNSWGGAERTDSKTYMHDNETGFHLLKSSYLFGQIANAEGDGTSEVLSGVVLPEGY